MSTYLLVHRQPPDYTGTPEAAAAWEAWFTKLGEALIDKGNAVLSDRGVVGQAGPVLPLGGYTRPFPAIPARPPHNTVGTARLTRGHHPNHTANSQLNTKCEDLTRRYSQFTSVHVHMWV